MESIIASEKRSSLEILLFPFEAFSKRAFKESGFARESKDSLYVSLNFELNSFLVMVTPPSYGDYTKEIIKRIARMEQNKLSEVIKQRKENFDEEEN